MMAFVEGLEAACACSAALWVSFFIVQELCKCVVCLGGISSKLASLSLSSDVFVAVCK
jgi:hypothetical protein